MGERVFNYNGCVLGELDDTRLIEGITGERSIYKKRADQDPEPGSPQEKPKKLRILVDVSGSMYRFNGRHYFLRDEEIKLSHYHTFH